MLWFVRKDIARLIFHQHQILGMEESKGYRNTSQNLLRPVESLSLCLLRTRRDHILVLVDGDISRIISKLRNFLLLWLSVLLREGMLSKFDRLEIIECEKVLARFEGIFFSRFNVDQIRPFERSTRRRSSWPLSERVEICWRSSYICFWKEKCRIVFPNAHQSMNVTRLISVDRWLRKNFYFLFWISFSHGLWWYRSLFATFFLIVGHGLRESKFLLLNGNTLFQIMFHKSTKDKRQEKTKKKSLNDHRPSSSSAGQCRKTHCS